MNSAVSLDKIGYMMNKLGGDDELSVDDLEEMIVKVFVSSFEQEHGFEADLVRALLAARYALLSAEAEDDEEIALVPSEEVETKYLKYQSDMYVSAGYDRSYADESASWPDALPRNGDWDAKFLREIARKEVAHHLVVLDQIRAEVQKRAEEEKDKKDDNVNADS